jgi:5-formyltetrahydrofolate cyclo-ligase
MSGQKAALRKILRAKRRSLSASDHRRRSSQAAKAVSRLPMFKNGARVAIYLPFDRETNTAPLIAAARRRGVRLFVPVVSDRRHARLRFYPLGRKTRRGVFGIAVPERTTGPVAPRWFDVVVIPLVGIDTAGLRLGMGGGFYDRALAFRRRRRHWHGPRLVGFGFDCQRTDLEFAESWDLRLDSLATESGLQHFSRGGGAP